MISMFFMVLPPEKCQLSSFWEIFLLLGRGEHLVQQCFVSQLPPFSPDPRAIGKEGTCEPPQPAHQSWAPMGVSDVCA